MFTTDWFSVQRPVWEREVRPRVRTDADILEVGAWEGECTTWMARAWPASRITCVDTWRGGEEHDAAGMEAVKQRFDANVAEFGDRVVPIQDTSRRALAQLAARGQVYDLIYIDGSHHSADVLTDAVLAFSLAKVGALIVFDDYGWIHFRDPAMAHHNPKQAIETFLFCFRDEVEVLHIGWQVMVRKTKHRD